MRKATGLVLGVLGVFLTMQMSMAEEFHKEGTRQIVKLTGTWEMQASPRISFPPEEKWEKVDFQEPWFKKINWGQIKPAWGSSPGMWYKKRVTIPDEWKDKRIKIKFWAVAHKSFIYFNGNKVGENSEGFSPFEIDVTEVARFGEENELLVGVEKGGGLTLPAKSPTAGSHYGVWQKVELIAYPEVYVKDVFVKPSVRKKSIGVEITISNEDDRPRTIMLSNSVQDGINFPKKGLALNPKEERTLVIEKKWRNPVYWSWENPHLYNLRTEIGYEGNIIDEVKTRFGFREFWAEGPDLYLNGIKVRLNAPGWYSNNLYRQIVAPFDEKLTKEAFVLGWKDYKKVGYNAMRTHANPFPPIAYESADEAGVLIVAETALFGGGTPDKNATPDEIDELLEHTKRFVLRNRNHPSIVMWSGGNEQSIGSPAKDEFFSRQMDLFSSIDPTRVITHSGMGKWFPEIAGESLSKKQMVYNFHYIENILNWPYWGIFPDVPNRFYWPIDENVWPGVGGWSSGYRFIWKKDKPVLVGEHLGPAYGEWAAGVAGDKMYEQIPGGHGAGDWDDPDYANYKAMVTIYKMVLEAYRISNVSMLSPHFHKSLEAKYPFSDSPFAKIYARELLADFGVFIKEYDHHFYADEEVNRTVAVYNESLKRKRLTLSWRLTLEEKVIGRWDKKLNTKPGEVELIPLTFTAPNVLERKKAKLTLSLLDGNNLLYSKGYVYDIFPRKKIEIPAPAKIALFDPLGKTEKIFKKEGLQFEIIKDFKHIGNIQPKLLVLGSNSLSKLSGDKNLKDIADIIEGFVKEGGNVLVFEQENLPRIFPSTLKHSNQDEVVRTKYWLKQEDFGLATICFLRAKGHPVLKGLEEDDLKFWRDDNIVTTNNLDKPERGNFIILADSGFIQFGLSRTPLLEMPYGKGTYIVSQLDITSKYGKEPVASSLLENMINYGLSYLREEGRVGLLVSKSSSFYEVLNYDMGVIGKDAGVDELRDYDILLITGESLKGLDIKKVKQFVQDGGRVYLHNVTPGVKEVIEKLLDRKVTFKDYKLGPTIVNTSPLTLGLASYNLYWLEKFVSADVFQNLSQKGIRHILEIENSQALTNPEGLIKVNLGKGFIIVNQFLWEEESVNNRLKALNYASTLFTNLGIPLEKGQALSLRLPHEGSKVPVVRKPASGPYDVDSSGFIRDWLLCGPFPNRGERQDWEKGWGGKVGFEGWQKDYLVPDGGELMIEPEEGMGYKVPFPSFPPHWKEGTADINWHRHTSAEPRIDLGILTYRDLELTVPDYTVAYAACYVYSPEDRYVFMAFGSDDAYKVWLNHELIEESPTHRASAVDQDFFPVVLKKGYNLVLIKVDNSLWDWVLYLRFLDREKIPLTDITVWF